MVNSFARRDLNPLIYVSSLSAIDVSGRPGGGVVLLMYQKGFGQI